VERRPTHKVLLRVCCDVRPYAAPPPPPRPLACLCACAGGEGVPVLEGKPRGAAHAAGGRAPLLWLWQSVRTDPAFQACTPSAGHARVHSDRFTHTQSHIHTRTHARTHARPRMTCPTPLPLPRWTAPVWWRCGPRQQPAPGLRAPRCVCALSSLSQMG